MHRRFRLASTAAALATTLVLSGCGGDDDDTPAAGGTTSAAATSPPTSSSAAPAASTSSSAAAASSSPAAAGGGAKVAVAKSATLGDIVVDAQGFTLYRFDNDTNAPPASNCAGDCLTTWPPAITTGKPEAEGVDASLLGTLKLANGSEQITLAGWPLYRFAPDAKPGDANGQAVGGIWWAVTAKGDKAAAS